MQGEGRTYTLSMISQMGPFAWQLYHLEACLVLADKDLNAGSGEKEREAVGGRKQART